MPVEREQGTDAAPEAIRPGTLTALLQQLARAPQPDTRDGDEPPLSPGVLVARFRLVREIGRGGFGVVWEARDEDLDRAVALKMVRARNAAPARDERLLREAEAAARLSHPNIVTLYDAGQSERGPYLVLELLRGETLAERLDSGPMTPREAVRVAVEIAKGLAHAHGRGIVHRDLKPGNVFVCEDGQVKILDLGLATAFGRPKVDGGTPAYMAPEQWRGAPEDERSDVFALGVILYRMLAGELPFPGGDAELRGPRPAQPLEIPAAPSLPVLVARMLAKDPVERPRSAGEVLPRLATCLREMDETRGVVETSVRRRPRWPGLVAVSAAAVLVAVGVHVRRTSPPAAASAPASVAVSIAVLPFADLSPERDQEHFSDGIADEIRNTLTRVGGLRVIGRTSSVAFRGRGEDVRTIGEKLGIGAVLEGSVRKAGARVRVAVQLIEASHGTQLWSAIYDRELIDVFAVQAEIARDVVAAMDVRMQTGALAAVPERPTTSPAAYEAYLLGKRRFGLFSPDLPPAEMFEKAVALDPGFAPAWAELARSLVQWTHYVPEPGRELAARKRRAVEAAEKAVALAPQLPNGYEARAMVRNRLLWDWAGAKADVERLLALDPRSAFAHTAYAEMVGDPEKRLEHLRTAMELDPLSSVPWTHLGYRHLLDGELELARSELQRAVDLEPQGSVNMWNRAELELVAGRPADALAIFDRNHVESNRLLGSALAHHDLGHDRESRGALAELTAKYGDKEPYLVAAGHAWRGERDAAFDWLDRAFAQRSVALGFRVWDALLRNLHGDPRFAALLGKMGKPPGGWP